MSMDKSLNEKLLKPDKKDRELEVNIAKLFKKISEQSKILILLSIKLKSAVIENKHQIQLLKEQLENEL